MGIMKEEKNSPKQAMEAVKKSFNIPLWYLILGFFIMLMARDYWIAQTQTKHVPYNEFQQLLKDKKVSEVILTENEMSGVLTTPEGELKSVHTNRVDPETARS